MNTDKESPKQKKFRGIREACSESAYLKDFVLRIMNEFYRSTKTDPSLVPAGLKSELAQVRSPTASEKKAMELLGESVLKRFGPAQISQLSDGYKAGYAVATVLKFDDFVNGASVTPDDKRAIYSIAVAAHGFGNEVNDVTIGKVDEKTAMCRSLYLQAPELVEPIAAEFWNGFKDGNKVASLAETILEVGPQSAKFRFLVVLLGKYNDTFRNPSELQEFIQNETTLKLNFEPESFKRERNRVSWQGAKYSRSRRKKKLGDKVVDAVP